MRISDCSSDVCSSDLIFKASLESTRSGRSTSRAGARVEALVRKYCPLKLPVVAMAMGGWYPSHPSKSGVETQAHHKFRQAFAAHQNGFKNPISIVFHCKMFHRSIKRDVACLNETTISEQPILLFTAPAWSLTAGDVGEIHSVQDLRCFVPDPIRDRKSTRLNSSH